MTKSAKSTKPRKSPAKSPKPAATAANPPAIVPVSKKATRAKTAQPRTIGAAKPAFPIVGIGCSAGGLEALEQFFRQVPEDSNMAFVVVQHLDPHHASTLPDLLRHATPLAVAEAKNRMKVRPGNLYIIPPNKELTLLHDTLYLLEPSEKHGLRLPVDFFLRTLAEDRSEGAIGVILSGMGSDGVLGLRAIKEKGGLVLVQDPAEAKASGMPRSAIDAGLADIVAPAAEIPAQISAYVNQPRRVIPEGGAVTAAHSALEKIVILLRDRRGADFSGYKTSTLYRRIERRTALHQLPGIAAYVRYLRENPQELDLLFKELLIGVTNFFRDRAVWETLRGTALPALFARHPKGATLRAWVPACSSGEEAYSLAITFRDALEKVKPEARFSLQIYATDIDADAIDKARRALYPANISADVSPERLARYFVADEGGGYHIVKDIRDMVVFAPQNVISDPPFTKLDILCCRNFLIYLGPSLQKKLLPLFYYALNRDGLLVLGTAETVGSFTDLFEPLDAKAHIFRRLHHEAVPVRLEFPTRQPVEPEVAPPAVRFTRRDSMEYLTDQLIQQSFSPACVLVTGEGDILYISGRTGKYLEPAAGKVNINVHAMARPGLREALSGVIRSAQRQDHPIRLNGIRIGTNGDTQIVDVLVQGISNPEPLRGRVLIVFYDVPQAPETGSGRKKTLAVSGLELELRQTREALRSAHEEMQTSVEEYKSANEELQSTNEELQSANEELTTSREELQSLNEELQTVNAEMESKVDELTGVRNDMINLLNATEIATIFLDNALRLRRFTPHATHLFKLIPADIGRSLSDIATDLKYPQLKEDIMEVLRTLVFREKQVETQDGRWYRVRIMPYRTLENLIDGVAITFIDISDTKRLERRLNELTAGQKGATPKEG